MLIWGFQILIQKNSWLNFSPVKVEVLLFDKSEKPDLLFQLSGRRIIFISVFQATNMWLGDDVEQS